MQKGVLNQSRLRGVDALPVLAISLIASVGIGLAIVASEAVPWVTLGLASAVGMAFLVKSLIVPSSQHIQERAEISKAFLFALALRIALAFIFYGLLVLVDWRGYGVFFFDDEPFFDEIGRALAEEWRQGYFAVGNQDAYPFVYFIAGIYYLFGYQPLLVRIFNAALSAVIPVLIYAITRDLFPDRTRLARVALWLAILSPDLLLWSVSSMRDIQISLGVVSLVYIMVSLHRRPSASLRNLLVGPATLLFVFLMRRVVGWFLVLALGTYALLYVFLHKTRQSGLALALRLVGVVGIIAITHLVSVYQFEYKLLDFSTAQDYVKGRYLENPTLMSRYYARDSGYLSKMFSENPYELRTLGFGLVRGMLLPNPLWIVTVPSVSSGIMFLPGVVWLVLIPFWLLGGYLLLREGNARVIFVVLLTLGLFVGGSSGIAATMEPVRARVPVLPLIYILAAYGIAWYRSPAERSPLKILPAAYAVFVMLLGGHYLIYSSDLPVRGLSKLFVVVAVVAVAILWLARVLRRARWR